MQCNVSGEPSSFKAREEGALRVARRIASSYGRGPLRRQARACADATHPQHRHGSLRAVSQALGLRGLRDGAGRRLETGALRGRSRGSLLNAQLLPRLLNTPERKRKTHIT